MGYAAQIETSEGALHAIASSLYGVCNTRAADTEKIVTLPNFDTLLTGVMVQVKFTNGNTATNPTLNVNSIGAYPIYMHGTSAPGNTVARSWAANSMVSFTFDGTAWRMNDVGANNAIIDLLEGKVTTETNRASQAEAGLAEDVANLNTGKEPKALKFTDKSATFTEGNGITNFEYRAAVVCEGVTSDMIPYVSFSGDNAGSGDYAPYCQTYNGGVYLYAAVSGTITVPSIVCWRP